MRCMFGFGLVRVGTIQDADWRFRFEFQNTLLQVSKRYDQRFVIEPKRWVVERIVWLVGLRSSFSSSV